MSNPGVIALAEGKIGQYLLKIEDNIGEAIHIHFGNIRLDLTIKEFIRLADEISTVMEKMIDVPGFYLKNYDAIFLTECADRILNLKEIVYDEAYIENLKTDMITEEKAYLTSISESRVVKALQGDKALLNARKQINYYGLSNEDRLERIYSSVKSKGYPAENHYIIVSEDGTYVLDGCHRASCLYELFGNIKIPIERWMSKTHKYTDEYEAAELERLSKKLVNVRENKRNTKKLLMENLCNKKIAIKGAGKHTEELLKLMEGALDIVCIIADNVFLPPKYANIPTYQDVEAMLQHEKIDVVLISSYRYRHEMKEEMKKYKDKFQIFDIYEYGIKGEFFT